MASFLFFTLLDAYENYKAVFFTLAFFKIPPVEKSRNEKEIYLLAEIFAWESRDYRCATNVENSN